MTSSQKCYKNMLEQQKHSFHRSRSLKNIIISKNVHFLSILSSGALYGIKVNLLRSGCGFRSPFTQETIKAWIKKSQFGYPSNHLLKTASISSSRHTYSAEFFILLGNSHIFKWQHWRSLLWFCCLIQQMFMEYFASSKLHQRIWLYFFCLYSTMTV